MPRIGTDVTITVDAESIVEEAIEQIREREQRQIQEAVERATDNPTVSFSTSNSDYGAAVEEFTTDRVDYVYSSRSLDLDEIDSFEQYVIQKRLRSNQDMPDTPVGTWAFNRFSEQYSIQDAAEILSSGGAGSLTEELFDRAVDGMTERVDDGSDEARAFNRETSDWPHEIRARLAGYLLVAEPSWVVDNEIFANELERFARTGEYHPGGENGPFPDEIETEMDALPENPFERDEFDDDMATAYLVVWANGENPEQVVFNEVSDVNDFRWWVEKTGDLDDSLRAHHFGRDVPIEVIRHALPPDEWEELEPNLSENEMECARCSHIFYEIETPEGIFSATNQGDLYEGRAMDMSDDDTPIYNGSASNGRQHICPSCTTELMENPPDSTYVLIDEDGNVGEMWYNSGLALDASVNGPNYLNSISEVDDDVVETLLNFFRGGSVMGFVGDEQPVDAIEINSYHQESAGYGAFETIAEQRYDVASDLDGPLIMSVEERREELTIYAPSNDPNIVMMAKSLLKNPGDYV